MTSDVVHATAEPVIEEIGVQLDILDAHGATYVRAYLEHFMLRQPRPQTPAGMHPMVAEALRDLARDEATAVRLYGSPRPPRHPVTTPRAPAREAAA